ncbi:bifunctional hydroxymethylpyrimidine kinase/phosphomethylpyrimidine kinase [Patescibacteria group bacterium]|nr:bifunctional hydroxymethylpyrimidine kinase/phosphomethylpyrimidine kinase [Patescibacteria group bacterium]MBU4511821.1 bifunctional hydroxymethylpyrimidine kinase/phosphomethylpyrimidine kinase [Patescibacteria group bacterium]MCG2692729.1 PfkB family carbohydrate kinase [Candidatus Parcubacteria bacterium]
MPKITVISTFAQDKIIYKEPGKTITRKGGPAFWIDKTLKDLKVDFDFICPRKQAKVEVVVSKKGETGFVKSVDKINLTGKRTARAFIISTVADEFDLTNLTKLNGLIALDIQGYARDIKVQKKTKLQIAPDTYQLISILKVTKEELKFLDKEFTDNQKKRILIITKGEQGAEIFSGGKRYVFPARKTKVKDTIGAGDVFLTAFVAEFIKIKDAQKAGKFAIGYVEQFLADK